MQLSIIILLASSALAMFCPTNHEDFCCIKYGQGLSCQGFSHDVHTLASFKRVCAAMDKKPSCCESIVVSFTGACHILTENGKFPSKNE
ncbi:hypothetical protein GGI43DRAFT_403295 [Trichoderma evansii]